MVKGANVEKGVRLGHVHWHVVCPFQDLRRAIGQEGFGEPAAKQLDAVAGVVHEEQRYGSSTPNELCSNFLGVEAKFRFAAVG
jgi:hypothetical protein